MLGSSDSMAASTAIQNGPKSVGSGMWVCVSGVNCAKKILLVAAGKNPVPCGPRDSLEKCGTYGGAVGAIYGYGTVV